MPADAGGAALRRVEDAAYGLRRMELARGIRFDLSHSLVGQLQVSWLDEAR